MTLNWTDKNPDDPSDSLSRNFTLIFSMNNTTNVYGVSLIKGVYELKSRNETDPKTNSTVLVKDYVSFTTFNLQPWEFSVSKNRYKRFVALPCYKLKTSFKVIHVLGSWNKVNGG